MFRFEDFAPKVAANFLPSDTMNGQANGHVRDRSQHNYGKIKAEEKNGVHSVTNEDNQLKEWIRTRRLGFMSFIIPVSIILVLATEKFGGAAYSAIHSTWGWEPIEKTILYFSLWAAKEVFLNIFKYWLMVHAFGMSKAHYNLIIGPRSEWTGKEVDIICNTYGRKRIKIMDAINRRMGHTVINIFRIVFYVYVCDSNELRLKTAMLQLPVISTLKILTESGNRFFDIGRYIFQGSRVFDGRYGRFNLVVVNFWAYAGRIIMFELLVRSNQSDEAKGILFALSMMPLLWGDSFGEIIGSFFGKLTFQVRGLGDVNTKTVEGTFAVFASSFVAQIVMFYYVFGLSNELGFFIFHPVLVFFYTCVIAAFVESAAPRSTDNFFLQVFSLVVLMVSVR